jgi:hypothetical protein
MKAILAKTGVEVTDKLMTEQIEVDPAGIAPAFFAAKQLPVEVTGFLDISDLHSDMEGCQLHGWMLQRASLPLTCR